MASVAELVQQMRSSPATVRYAEACAVADAFFGTPRQHGTSHRIWKMPWAGDPRVNLQEGESGKAKAYQIQQLLKAIDRYQQELAKKAEEPTDVPKETNKEKRKRKGKKKRG
jgi:hypothetical protein